MVNLLRSAICGLLVLMPGILPAATLTATFATDVAPFSGWVGASSGDTAFVIEFDDSLGGTIGVLEQEEFISFDWVTNPYTTASGDEARTFIGGIPTIPGLTEGWNPITAGAGPTPSTTFWRFQQAPNSSTSSVLSVNTFSYAIVLPPPPSAVPLPAALPLLGAGLFGLLALRRRRRTAQFG
jgi:hypothetical protein